MPRKRTLPACRSAFERGHHVVEDLPRQKQLAAAVPP